MRASTIISFLVYRGRFLDEGFPPPFFTIQLITMENKFTPGPWIQDTYTVYALEHHGWKKGEEQFRNRFSAGLQAPNGTPSVELYANAKLIAAAPDLLEALTKYFQLMHKSETEQHFDQLLQDFDWNNKAKQAILKATTP